MIISSHTRVRQKKFCCKIKHNIPKVFHPTDKVPFINFAWEHSFARTESNWTAIISRGWSPCNYALLTCMEELRTKFRDEQQRTEAGATSGSNTCTVTIDVSEGTSAAIFDTVCD
jgi:hypothetical protein